MSPPRLPNELLTHIFSDVYDSCRQASSRPPSVNSILSPLTLVNRSWRSQALPLLVRHYHRPSTFIPRFIDFIHKYDLVRAVKSIHFDFKIPPPSGFQQTHREMITFEFGVDLDDYDIHGEEAKDDECMRRWMRETHREAKDAVIKRRTERATEELKRWIPLMSLCMPYVEEVEVGKRIKNKADETLNDVWDKESWMEFWQDGRHEGGPGGDLVQFLGAMSPGPNVKKMRINLIEGIHIGEIPPSLPERFPRLEDLTVHQYIDRTHYYQPSLRQPRALWRNLRRLELVNTCCDKRVFTRYITEPFLEHSATTLNHLIIRMYTRTKRNMEEIRGYQAVDIFQDLVFPSVDTALLTFNDMSIKGRRDVKLRFPAASRLYLKIEVEGQHY